VYDVAAVLAALETDAGFVPRGSMPHLNMMAPTAITGDTGGVDAEKLHHPARLSVEDIYSLN